MHTDEATILGVTSMHPPTVEQPYDTTIPVLQLVHTKSEVQEPQLNIFWMHATHLMVGVVSNR